jgi:hypothetical protein
MLKNSSIPIAALAALTFSFLLPASVAAGTITVFDLTETVTFNVSSDIATRVSGGCKGEFCQFIILDPPNTVGASYTARTNIFGIDGLLSDTFEFASGKPTFNSDPLQPFARPFSSLFEDGSVLLVGVVSFFNSAGNIIETDRMYLQSDAEAEAPEPSSILLTLAGLTVLGAVSINRRWRVPRRA